MKDFVVWCGCLGLFLAGGVYFNMLPNFFWEKELGVGDLVSGASAIAAALAAYASWKAATIAKTSAEDSKAFTRAQLYMSHRKDFIDLLDEIADELKVVFFRRYDLYTKLFPNNHYSSEFFEAKANLDVVNNWVSKYAEVERVTKGFPVALEIDLWVMSCSDLSESMHFVFPRSEEPQLYLYASSRPIQTQFHEDPSRPVFYLGEAMNKLLAFGGREKVEPVLLMDHPFTEHFAKYFRAIANGHDMHCVTRPSDAMKRS